LAQIAAADAVLLQERLRLVKLPSRKRQQKHLADFLFEAHPLEQLFNIHRGSYYSSQYAVTVLTAKTTA
jgi:hypothetical protein